MTPPMLAVTLAAMMTAAGAQSPAERFTARLASGELRLPPQAYRMTDLGEHNGTLPADLVLATETGLLEPSCRHRCLHRPDCLGTAYRPSDRLCLLSARRPAPDRLEPNEESWVLAARRGIVFLDESCERDEDCRLVVPWSECRAGVCVCRHAVYRTIEDECVPRGEMVPASGGRAADSALMNSWPATDAETCQLMCTVELHCLAAELTADSCSLFSQGITKSADNNSSQSWAKLLEGPPGIRPEELFHFNGTWFINTVTPPLDYLTASGFCAERGGIVWPGGSADAERALERAGLLPPPPDNFWLGLDDITSEGQFMRSDGRPATDIRWSSNQPDNFQDNENCVESWEIGSAWNDVECGAQRRFVCQSLGRNVSLGRPAWLTSRNGNDPALGTDGLLLEPVRSRALQRRQSWTVDLGREHQVVGFLYVPPPGGADSLGGTMVRVGSDALRTGPAVSALCRQLSEPPLPVPMGRYYVRLRVPRPGTIRSRGQKPRKAGDSLRADGFRTSTVLTRTGEGRSTIQDNTKK
ncbi:uncharacterized protein LOC122378396 [Amphibalanus amphitrite]|uniref:uncharacterized protein LOC122378396 n=1 Tax=Amphibalanus amphitrite TaxID=1232801 RepID=UPI001C916C3D|nr:uncharacterized protein LOC122378396 [Amphibalanus amphitrite]